MNKKPVFYEEWREAYHECAISIGFKITTCWHCRHLPLPNRSDGYTFKIDRHLWKLLHRYERLRRRLDAEHENMTEGFARAVLEAMRK